MAFLKFCPASSSPNQDSMLAPSVGGVNTAAKIPLTQDTPEEASQNYKIKYLD